MRGAEERAQHSVLRDFERKKQRRRRRKKRKQGRGATESRS